jgi:hypothetical protein
MDRKREEQKKKDEKLLPSKRYSRIYDLRGEHA